MRTPVIRTYTGHEFNPLDPKTSDINISDIAHGLATCARFAGHLARPVWVAHHSVFVANLCQHLPIPYQLQALCHDASEAYLGDVTKWVKESPGMAFYREAEARMTKVIFETYDIPLRMHPDVEYADRVMVRYEGTHPHGFGKEFVIDHPNYPALTKEERFLVEQHGWIHMSWQQAEEMFLNRFLLLKRV